MIDKALDILRNRGHNVETNPGAFIAAGTMHVLIDGKLRSSMEILQMAETVDEDAFAFEAGGKNYEVHFHFPSVPYRRPYYQILEDGKLFQKWSPTDENEFECIRRIACEFGGLASLRRFR